MAQLFASSRLTHTFLISKSRTGSVVLPVRLLGHNRGENQNHDGRKQSTITTAAASSFGAAFAAVTAAVQQSSIISPGAAGSVAVSTASSFFISGGVFILCVAAAIFLVCSIPTLWSMARLANQATVVLKQIEQELPETASMLRLSGMEVTDCITELSGLGADLSQGVKSTAKLVTMTESGVQQAANVVTASVKPALAAKETQARNVIEAGLQERAKLNYSLPQIRQVASQTTDVARKVRLGTALLRLAGGAVKIGSAVRGKAHQVALQYAAQAVQTAQQYEEEETYEASPPTSQAQYIQKGSSRAKAHSQVTVQGTKSSNGTGAATENDGRTSQTEQAPVLANTAAPKTHIA